MSGVEHENARALLAEGYTCAVYQDEKVYKSKKRGVVPLLEWLKSGENFQDFAAMDKVVGKAAAFLYLLLGVRSVYALVISEEAERVLLSHGVAVEYADKVAAIRNRTNTGFCPMEQAVWEIEDENQAHAIILQTLERLKS